MLKEEPPMVIKCPNGWLVTLSAPWQITYLCDLHALAELDARTQEEKAA